MVTVNIEVGESAGVRVERVADGQSVRIAKVDLTHGNIAGYDKPEIF